MNEEKLNIPRGMNKAGWYWARYKEEGNDVGWEIVEVYSIDNLLVARCGSDMVHSPKENWEWGSEILRCLKQ